jgi:hypothetical protein
MLLYIIQRGGRERLHQRQSPPFPHTLLSAYLCHDDITIPSYSIIHIVSPHKLYLHDKSLPRAHTPPHKPRTTLGIQQHYSLYHFSTIIFPNKKRCTKRCGGRRCTRRCARRCSTGVETLSAVFRSLLRTATTKRRNYLTCHGAVSQLSQRCLILCLRRVPCRRREEMHPLVEHRL